MSVLAMLYRETGVIFNVPQDIAGQILALLPEIPMKPSVTPSGPLLDVRHFREQPPFVTARIVSQLRLHVEQQGLPPW